MCTECGFGGAVEEGGTYDYEVKSVVKRTKHVMAGKKNLSELSSPLPRSLAVYKNGVTFWGIKLLGQVQVTD